MSMKRAITFLLCLVLCLGALTACGTSAPKREEKETWLFTDSCGREVAIPVEIDTVVPSGSLAQIVLHTICPDKLQSLATALTRTQKQYFDVSLWSLPVTGQLYGGSGTLNYEEVAAASPDIIIDVGEELENIAQDMDDLQAATGIPVIFIQADLDTMAEAYETLGKVLGEEEQANACAAYIRQTLSEAAEYSTRIPENERKRVIYTQGEYGTEVMGVGSLHAEVLEYAAAVNIAEVGIVNGKGGNEVSMEQICLWDPNVVILAPDSNYDEIYDDPTWQTVSAVKNGQAYETPKAPYNWMDQPPSVQRVLAIKWLGNLLYPDVFDYDMAAETREFFGLFYHYDLTEAEARELLANSTFRED